MNKELVKKFEATLRHLETEIVRQIEFQDHGAIEVDRGAEDTERFSMTNERALAAQTQGHNSYLLREIRSALNRIQEGIYGDCVDCDMQISERRLAAVPWARRCLACQERLDHAVPGASRTLIRAA